MSLGRVRGIEAREKLMVGFGEMRLAGVIREDMEKGQGNEALSRKLEANIVALML